MLSDKRDDQRDLADAIRAGSKRGPQCFGSYFDEHGGSCALGAAYDGIYLLPPHHEHARPHHLERLFRCLDDLSKRCPGGCKKQLPLAAMIVHLNDDHEWTREQIAEWLTAESDPNPSPGQSPDTNTNTDESQSQGSR